MLSFSSRFFLVATAGVLLTPFTAFGAPITSGTLGLVPNGGNVTVSATGLTWECFLICSPGKGDFVVTTHYDPGSGDLFGVVGEIGNFDNSIAPLNTIFSLPDVLVFSVVPGLHFELTRVNLGVSGTAGCGAPSTPGDICTPDGIAALVTPENPTGRSPFNLQNLTETSSTASFGLAGIAYIGTAASGYSLFTGTFQATFDNLSLEQLIDQLCPTAACDGSVTTPYSATITLSAVPEPNYFTAVGGMLLGLGALSGRLRKRKA